MTHTTRRALVALASISLVAAACGGDDDTASDATTSGAEATSAATAAGGSATTAAGGSATGDTAAGDTATGDTAAGDTAAGDTASGDTAAGDTASGDTAAGDTASGDTAASGGDAGSGPGAHGPGSLLGDNGSSDAGWTVSTDDCTDPEAANAPIEGTIMLGTSLPLSGGPAATAYAPYADGLRAYVAYANEHELIPGHDIELQIGDDKFDPGLTPGVVNGLLDQGAQAMIGIIGSGPSLAVRDLLNEECVPQMFGQSGLESWGEVEAHPWSFGHLIPYNIEGGAYAHHVNQTLGEGATAMTYYVNIEFGQALAHGFEQVAPDEGIELLGSQTIEATETAPPTAQVQAIASQKPDVIMAVPLGAQCPVFLSELANAKAANPGWDPVVYMTATCASKQILGSAGEAGNGVLSAASAGLRDPDDPAQQDVEAVQTYRAAMEAGGYPDTSISVGAAGWSVMETTVEILRQAAESDAGLTRASIINSARNLWYHSSMTRDGVEYKMSGDQDGWYVEDVQIVQWDSANQVFADVGDLITDFRYS